MKEPSKPPKAPSAPGPQTLDRKTPNPHTLNLGTPVTLVEIETRNPKSLSKPYTPQS